MAEDAQPVGRLIRSDACVAEGADWLENLSQAAGRSVLCAADFMGRDRMCLEAEREDLYQRLPVAPGWHELYAAGRATTRRYAPDSSGDVPIADDPRGT